MTGVMCSSARAVCPIATTVLEVGTVSERSGTLTADQFRLVNRSAAPWLTLWLISNFEVGRAYAVGSMAGGTYIFADDDRGQYETTGKGMAAWRKDRSAPEVTVTWGEVKRWIESLPRPTRETAAALLLDGRELQRAYPSPYPGIGRQYAWDRPEGCTPEERKRDMADLHAANAKRALEVEAWQGEKAEHDRMVQRFLTALEPDEEPSDLLELLAAGVAS